MARDDIVNAAMGWLGTPYRHQASLKGVGCDCLGLVRGVWREVVGPEPETPPAYTRDWAEAGAPETLMGAAGRHLQAIEIDAVEPGDVVLFRWRAGFAAKHAGILAPGNRFIHAHEGAVVAMAPLGPWWRARIAAAFRFPDIE
jgi:NlpC/P60 family putative phage cell wall peptidase